MSRGEGTIRKNPGAYWLAVSVIWLMTQTQMADAATQIYYVHNDHLGTPVKLTDNNQAVVWEAFKKPFGETQATSGIAEDSRFPGQYYDSESGLAYNYFRDYDPSLGRYVQSDPIGLKGGLNTYGYALQNPVRYIDPRGLEVPTALACSAFFAGYNAGGWLQASPRDAFLESYERLNQQLADLDNEISQCDDVNRQAHLEKIRKEHIEGMLDLIGAEYGDMAGMTPSGLGSLAAQGALCAVLLLVPGP